MPAVLSRALSSRPSRDPSRDRSLLQRATTQQQRTNQQQKQEKEGKEEEEEEHEAGGHEVSNYHSRAQGQWGGAIYRLPTALSRGAGLLAAWGAIREALWKRRLANDAQAQAQLEARTEATAAAAARVRQRLAGWPELAAQLLP